MTLVFRGSWSGGSNLGNRRELLPAWRPVEEVPRTFCLSERDRQTDPRRDSVWAGTSLPRGGEGPGALGRSGSGLAVQRLTGRAFALRLPEAASFSLSQVEGSMRRFFS